jgi:hypothetical protein
MRFHRLIMNSLTLRQARRRCSGLACAALLALGACAQPWQGFQVGEPESDVIARLGPPREVYDLPNGAKRLMWPTQPMGEVTTAADIDVVGKVISVRQVLQPSAR